MKFFLSFSLLLSVYTLSYAQVAGNRSYTQQQIRPQYGDNHNYIPQQINSLNLNFYGEHDFIVSVNGLSNIKADTYVALFHLTQMGQTVEESNLLMDRRIQGIENRLDSIDGIQTHVDMICFVPMYEYEADKKMFSRKTYNEIPAGFELKKNLHIQYSDPQMIHQLMSICAGFEVYDLVKVEYICTNMAQKKQELIDQARKVLEEKVQRYEKQLGLVLDTLERHLVEGTQIFYPSERYQSYQAYSSSSISPKRNAKVNQSEKPLSLYYQEVVNKTFDFVIDPVVLMPEIQVIYEINLKFKRVPQQKITTEREYFLLTPSGDLKQIDPSR